MKNFTLPQSATIVFHPEKREAKKGGEQMTVARLRTFLAQVNEGTWSQDQMHVESEAVLRAFEEHKEEEEEDLVRMDYKSKQVEDIGKKCQTIAKGGHVH